MPELTKLVGLTITSVEVVKSANGETDVLHLEAIGADETPDIDGEIFDYNGSKPYILAWSGDAETTTKAAGQEISYGNVRAQHGAKGSEQAAGKFYEPLDFDDKEKCIKTHVEVVDADAIKKVLKGVYRGLSIKGALVGKKWKDGKYDRYIVNPTEFSLVDKPANPNAKITIVKADGSKEVIEPEESAISKAATILHEMSPEEVKELITMATEIEKAAAIEKMKAARKAHDQAGACLSGYCGHGDVAECAEKVAEAHGKVMEAFGDSDKKTAKKAATTEEAEKAAALEVQKAAEEIAKAAAAKEPVTLGKLSEMIKTAVDTALAGAKDEIVKAAQAAGRPVPILPGAKIATKEGESNAGTEKDLVEKKSEIKADDPHRVSKIAAIERAAETELVKI